MNKYFIAIIAAAIGLFACNSQTNNSETNKVPTDYVEGKEKAIKNDSAQISKYGFLKESECKSTHEKAVCKFMWAWKDKKWADMARICQSSNPYSKNPDGLKMMLGFAELYQFKITSSEKGELLPDGSDMMKVNFDVVFKLNDIRGKEEKHLSANVIKEKGRWGVNPISVTRNLSD
jgi:hypothetical protein